MVAFTLPASTNRTAIRDGRRYVLLAEPRDPGSRNPHPPAGGLLHLRTPATATRAADRLPEAQVAFSGVVTFAVEGVVRVLEKSVAAERDGWRQAARLGEGMANLLAQAEQASNGNRGWAADRIADAAGFKDYAALWASIAQDDGEVVARHVMAWVL